MNRDTFTLLWDDFIHKLWHHFFDAWENGTAQRTDRSIFSLPSWQGDIEAILIKEKAVMVPAPVLPVLTALLAKIIIDITGSEKWHLQDQVNNNDYLVVKPFFEGSFGFSALIKSLLEQRPPTVGFAVQKSLGGSWFVLDQATLGIRSPLALRAALVMTGARLSQMLPRCLARIPEASQVFTPIPAVPMPTTVDYIILALRQGLNRLQRIVTKPFFRLNHWEIAISSSKKNVWKTIPTTVRAFHADPFLFTYQGRTWLFFEYFVYRTGKATIAVREVHDDLSVGPLQVVLDMPHHFSYPVILEYEGNIYMMPCTSKAGVEVYRATAFPYEWAFQEVMLPDLPIADATPLFYEGRWWLFGSISYQPTPNWDEVFVFYSHSPFGPWQPHAKNPVKAHAFGARPAGNFFMHENRLYRPGQNCQGGYGQSVAFFEVKVLTPEDYHEVPVEKLDFIPDINRRWHTYNQSGDIQVIDVKVPKRLI